MNINCCLHTYPSNMLFHYILDGRYYIGNNLVENSVRPVVVGQKGYFFCYNHDASKECGRLLLFMCCCKLADIDPNTYSGPVYSGIL
jgi:hypothetical protein